MGGFSAVLGNPPFLGGQKLTSAYGDQFRAFIVQNIAQNVRGSADLCVYFLLNCEWVLDPKVAFSGIVYTNTISEGDSREVGIDQIYPKKLFFSSVLSDQPWDGQASVVVTLITSSREKDSSPTLNGKIVGDINNRLTEGMGFNWQPRELKNRKEIAFMGDNLYGSGFMIDSKKYAQFIQKYPKSNTILREYLNGKCLVSKFPIQNDGYVICAEEYEEQTLREKFLSIYEHLESTVKVSRQKAKSKKDREIWWKFTAYRKKMRDHIGDLEYVFVRPQSSSTHGLLLSDTKRIHSIKCILFATNSWGFFATYQSNIYERWIWEYSSSLSSTISYSISDCFLTFPKLNVEDSEGFARKYYLERERIMLNQNVGLTDFVNSIAEDQSNEIVELKRLHRRIDIIVAEQLGISISSQDYQLVSTKFGKRWTINDEKWIQIHQELLKMNKLQFMEEEL